MPTKAELEEQLAEAEAALADAREELSALRQAPHGGPEFVQWREVGAIPGWGVVSPLWVSRNPPPAALRAVGHVVCDRATYEEFAQRHAFNPWADTEPEPATESDADLDAGDGG